jgi:hypothetical protein
VNDYLKTAPLKAMKDAPANLRASCNELASDFPQRNLYLRQRFSLAKLEIERLVEFAWRGNEINIKYLKST